MKTAAVSKGSPANGEAKIRRERGEVIEYEV